MVKDLKKSTNIDFEKDKYSEIRDVVTTIVHNHMNASAPMDVDKKFVMSIEGQEEGKQGEVQGPEGEGYAEEGQPVYNEEGGIVCYIGKGGGGNWQVKGKGKGTDNRFKGQCWIC